MTESDAFGAHDDGGDTGELEQLRREASLLREQLQNAAGGHRTPREVQQLEARLYNWQDSIESNASRP